MVPLVLVPGIQGRWQYMQPAIDALSIHFRVLTFELGDGRSIDDDVDAIALAMDEAGVERAVICGVSFGGAVALKFAARQPDRTIALVLASTPAPGWHLKKRHLVYTRLPWLFGPLFLAETPLRMRAEIAAALPEARARRAFKVGVLRTALSAPISFSRMAARARQLAHVDARADCRRITAPTLVVTGEPDLDHVVPATGSSEYAQLIDGAQAAVLERTGHIGTVTRPAAFAELVNAFVERHDPSSHFRPRRAS